MFCHLRVSLLIDSAATRGHPFQTETQQTDTQQTETQQPETCGRVA
jgi:hypothetical protein